MRCHCFEMKCYGGPPQEEYCQNEAVYCAIEDVDFCVCEKCKEELTDSMVPMDEVIGFQHDGHDCFRTYDFEYIYFYHPGEKTVFFLRASALSAVTYDDIIHRQPLNKAQWLEVALASRTIVPMVESYYRTGKPYFNE